MPHAGSGGGDGTGVSGGGGGGGGGETAAGDRRRDATSSFHDEHPRDGQDVEHAAMRVSFDSAYSGVSGFSGMHRAGEVPHELPGADPTKAGEHGAATRVDASDVGDSAGGSSKHAMEDGMEDHVASGPGAWPALLRVPRFPPPESHWVVLLPLLQDTTAEMGAVYVHEGDTATLGSRTCNNVVCLLFHVCGVRARLAAQKLPTRHAPERFVLYCPHHGAHHNVRHVPAFGTDSR